MCTFYHMQIMTNKPLFNYQRVDHSLAHAYLRAIGTLCRGAAHMCMTCYFSELAQGRLLIFARICSYDRESHLICQRTRLDFHGHASSLCLHSARSCPTCAPHATAMGHAWM